MPETQLKELLLQFSKTSVGDKGVSFKGKGLKLDSELDCKDVVDAIAKCPEMSYLDLEGNTLGVKAAEYIGKALEDRPQLSRALWRDMFTGRMKTEIPKALLSLGSGLTISGAMLTELDLSDNAFGPIGVEALADLLQSKVCYRLQELRLNNNGLGITGGKMLAKALLKGHANSLTEGHALALRVFVAGRNRLENDGATALSAVFKTLGSLEEITMPQNGIYHVGISKICEALVQNPNLRLLNLNDNTLTKKGATYLAEALPSLQKLQVLNLGDCLLKTQGATILAEALTSAHTDLEEVIWDSNEIRLAGGLALVNALKDKPKLKKLSLQDNEFGKKGRASLRNVAEKLHLGSVLDCPSDEDDVDDDDDGSDGDDNDDDDEDGSDGDEDDDDEPEEEESTEEIDEGNESLANVMARLPSAESSKCSDTIIGRFLAEPSADNFHLLAEKKVDDIISSLKNSSGEVDISTCLLVIMKISNLSSSKSEVVKTRSRELAISMYRAIFTWAESNNKLSDVNNALFVYLQLIKDEDKGLVVDWDVDRCVAILEAAIVNKIVPNFTQHILTCCLDRKHKRPNKETVHSLPVL